MSNPTEILRKFCDGTELGPFEIDQLKAAGFIAHNPTDHSWFVTATGHVALHQVPVPVELGATVERFKLGGALTGEEVKALRTWKLAEDSLYGARVTPLGESVHRQWAAARDAANHHHQLPPGDSASCPDEDSYHPPRTTTEFANMVARDTPTSAINVQEGGDHYKNLKIQPVEFIEATGIPFLEGCVIKRMCRHGSKAKAEDLRKAIHEIKLLLELRYGEKL